MPEFSAQKNVIIPCDSWYVKQYLVSIADAYENLDLIGNARADSVIYDLTPRPTGRKGRPAKHGRNIYVWEKWLNPKVVKWCFILKNPTKELLRNNFTLWRK